MPFYHKLGKIPPKRHTQFRKKDGSLYYEQLFGTIGFDGMSTNSYHEHRPTMVKEIRKQYSVKPKIAKANNIQSYRLRGFQVKPENDYLESRKVVLTNSDCNIILAAPKESTKDYFYKNTDADEVIFIHKGTGKLRTMLGNIDFKYGDYLVIPRGIIYKLDFDDDNNRLFIVESYHPVYTPKRYRNWFGQLLEHSPFCERDLRRPEELETYDELGDFLIKVKKQGEIIEMVYASHPFDVVGYDGYNFPYAFSIHDFEPITGRIHQVDGKKYKIEYIVEDGASDWPTFAEKSKKLIDQDQVPVVFGGWTSASRKAMLPVYESKNAFLYYPIHFYQTQFLHTTSDYILGSSLLASERLTVG